jgi:head-tail adaptor
VLSPTTDDPDEDTRDPDEDTKDPDADAETMDSEEPARAGVEKGEAEKSASLPRLLPYMSRNLPRLAGSQASAPQQSSKSEPEKVPYSVRIWLRGAKGYFARRRLGARSE